MDIDIEQSTQELDDMLKDIYKNEPASKKR